MGSSLLYHLVVIFRASETPQGMSLWQQFVGLFATFVHVHSYAIWGLRITSSPSEILSITLKCMWALDWGPLTPDFLGTWPREYFVAIPQTELGQEKEQEISSAQTHTFILEGKEGEFLCGGAYRAGWCRVLSGCAHSLNLRTSRVNLGVYSLPSPGLVVVQDWPQAELWKW